MILPQVVYINYVCEGCVVTHRLSLATRGVFTSDDLICERRPVSLALSHVRRLTSGGLSRECAVQASTECPECGEAATVVRRPEWVVPDVGAMSPSAWTFHCGATARALLVPALLGCSSHRRYRAARPRTPRRTLRPREKTPRCRAAELGCHTSRPMSSLGGGGRGSRAG